MADLIWQQKINKVIIESLTVPNDLPELGRVTGINVYPEVNRGEIYRGSLVVQGIIKCEVFYATPNLMSPEENKAEGPDWALGGLEETEDNHPEEELWGADESDPDPELEKEPVYCLYHNLVFRVPVEIPKREAGQKFEFVPSIEGVDYQVFDGRNLELSVNLNLDLSIQGIEIEMAPEPESQPLEVEAACVSFENVPEKPADPLVDAVIPPEVSAPDVPQEEFRTGGDAIDELLDQAVKEIGQGVDAVLSGSLVSGADEKSTPQINETDEIVSQVDEVDDVPQTVEAVEEELPQAEAEEPADLMNDVEEVFPTSDDDDDEDVITDVEEEAADEVERIEAEDSSEDFIPEAPDVAAEKIAQGLTDVVMKDLNQGAMIKFKGKKELQSSGGSSQKLVPAFKIVYQSQRDTGN